MKSFLTETCMETVHYSRQFIFDATSILVSSFLSAVNEQQCQLEESQK